MPDASSLLFAAFVAVQALCFVFLWRAPGRVPGRIMRALFLVLALSIAACAAHDADYTLLTGEALLGAAGWIMAGASERGSPGGRA